MSSRETTELCLPHKESKYPISRLSARFEPIKPHNESSVEEQRLYVAAMSQLENIAEQIRTLQEKAQEIIENTELDMRLHRAHCRFEKRVGIEYHLYERVDGSEYLSMISPKEWVTSPHKFVGSYTLRGDMSWRKT